MIFITNILISESIVALTPTERWEAAARGLNERSLITEPWFILAATSALAVLIFLLWSVSRKQGKQQKASSKQLFQELSERRGLSEQERELLIQVAERAGIQQKSSIFTMKNAFELGSSKMVEESLAEQKESENTEELRSVLFDLREKLGLQKQAPKSIRSGKLSSRQIPVGRKVHITRRKNRRSADIESLVIENNDIELLVRTAMPVRITPGEPWRVRYYFGASVWEFDTTAIKSDNHNLSLNHCDNIRFINRRRFLRVPVSKAAYVAAFPFSYMVTPKGTSTSKKSGTTDKSLSPAKFVPGTVTELAGPGFLIEAPLKVKSGDRILVIMKLDEQKEPEQNDNLQRKDSKSIRIIQDIAEVKHTKALDNNYSIAVELTGLSDTDINELIRATNMASLRAKAEGQAVFPKGTPDGATPENKAKESVTVKGT